MVGMQDEYVDDVTKMLVVDQQVTVHVVSMDDVPTMDVSISLQSNDVRGAQNSECLFWQRHEQRALSFCGGERFGRLEQIACATKQLVMPAMPFRIILLTLY